MFKTLPSGFHGRVQAFAAGSLTTEQPAAANKETCLAGPRCETLLAKTLTDEIGG